MNDDEAQQQMIADTAATPLEYLEKAVRWFRTEAVQPHLPRAGQINQRARIIAGVNANHHQSPQAAWKELPRETGLRLGRGAPLARAITAVVTEIEDSEPKSQGG